MNLDKYKFHKFALQFSNTAIESLYREYILKRTLLYCHIAWGLVIFLGMSFALLDRQTFGDKSNMVLIARIIISIISILIIASTFIKKIRKYQDWNAFFFILVIGAFCIFLIYISDNQVFTPYFTGFLFAFTGIFTIAGIGFRYSFFAFLINLVTFEIIFGIINPISTMIFLVYNFFLFGMVIIFIFLGYLVESISRRNYIVSAKLQDSLDEVQILSGLLPICSHCKNIRDDKGYWQQVEVYIKDRTEAEFSHSLCPGCVKALYSDEKWFNKLKNEEKTSIE